MTVFTLMLSTHYEGEMILGVYSTKDAATAASEAFVVAHYPEGELSGSDSFEIRPVEFDTAAKFHW